MRPQTTALVVAALSAVLGIGVAAASAQSGDIIILDELPSADAGTAAPDGGAPSDASVVDAAKSGIVIEGISESLPESPPREPKRENPREAFAEQIIAHAKACIRRHAVDQSNLDVGFRYLLRQGRPSATLSAVTNDDGIHLPRLYVDVTRAVGDTKPIDVEAQRRIFVECLQVVRLQSPPVVSERLSFRIKRTALALKPLDVEWLDL